MTETKQKLSIQQAQKLILLSQKLPPAKQSGNAIDSSLKAMEHLGYIQIDTISAIQRAHHHTLWSRNPGYKLSHLDDLIAQKKVFEYWSHAAAYLPMKDYRFSLPRKNALINGEEKHWYAPDKKLMKQVLQRIENEGPLMAKDFDGGDKKYGEWQSKPAKKALELLFMHGELMISKRNNFHKVYDLTERVLPDNIDTSMPTKEEYGRFLITSFLKANGIGKIPEIAYLRKNTKDLISSTIKEMLLSGELMQVEVADKAYFAQPASLELLNKPLRKSKLKILSPFDNLLIQRKRIKELFGFDYLLECYLPQSKRKYGYFALPILWDGRLVARIDCKAERAKSILHINHLSIEPTLKKTDIFAKALSEELIGFMEFNECSSFQLPKMSSHKKEAAVLNILKN